MRYFFLLLLLLVLCCPQDLLAQGGGWNDPNSWPCNCVPDGAARIPRDYTISISGSVSIGIVYVSDNATLLIDDGAGLTTTRISVDAEGTVVNEGTITIQDSSQGRPEAIGNSGLFNNRMTGRIFIQDVYGIGAINNYGGFENAGTLSIIRATGGSVSNRGTFSNLGTFKVRDASGQIFYNTGDEFINEGLIEADNVGPDFMRAIVGTITNSGTIRVNNPGELKMTMSSGAVFNNSGELSLVAGDGFLLRCTRGGRFNLSDGFVAGNGIIQWCDLNLAGELSPGNSPGRITFDSDLNFSGNYLWEAAGTAGPATVGGYDQVRINGRLNLTGSLTVNLLDDFVPESGDRFEIFSCGGGCAGSFNDLDVPDENWSVEVTGNSVWLVYTVFDPNAHNSLHFDGSDDYVLGTSNSSLELAAGTIDLWIKPATSTRRQTFLSYRSEDGFQTRYLWNFLENLDGVGFWNGSTYTAVFYNFSPDTWHHLTFVAGTGENVTMYVNGVAAGTFGGGFGTASGNSLKLILGTDLPGIEYFAGEMDELRVWQIVRSPLKIQQDFQCQAQVDQSCLLAYFPFNQGSAGADNSGEGILIDVVDPTNNGTLVDFALTGSTSNWVNSTVVTTDDCTCVPNPLTIIQPTQDLDQDGLADPLPFRYPFYDCQEAKVFRAPDPTVMTSCGGNATVVSFIFPNQDLSGTPLGPFLPNDFVVDLADGTHQMMIVAEDACQNRDTLRYPVVVETLANTEGCVFPGLVFITCGEAETLFPDGIENATEFALDQVFGSPQGPDGCNVLVSSTTESFVLTCGEGSLLRTFTVSDGDGNEICSGFQGINIAPTDCVCCPPGDLIISSQQDVTDFQQQYPECERLSGSLIVDGAAVNDLSGLSTIQEVTGFLTITETNLVSLAGLEGIAVIFGALFITDNPLLIDLSALANARGINQPISNITISNNPQLDNCAVTSVCDNVSNAGTSITLSGNNTNCNTVPALVAACLALPVELMSFTGKVVGKTHELSWTVFEEDLAAYAVQRRHAEATEWSLLTSVEATGLDQYAAVSIPDQPGEYLYRLGLREYDGTVTYSSLITLKSSPSSIVTLFPNPATGAVTVGQLAEGEKEISLLDGTGRVIFVKRTHEASLLLPTEALTAGLYFVVVKMDGEQEGLRLVLR